MDMAIVLTARTGDRTHFDVRRANCLQRLFKLALVHCVHRVHTFQCSDGEQAVIRVAGAIGPPESIDVTIGQCPDHLEITQQAVIVLNLTVGQVE